MPIASKIQLELDDQALDGVRRHVDSVFGEIGQVAAGRFMGGMASELNNLGPSFVNLGSMAESALGGISTGAIAATAGIAAIGAAAVVAGEQLYGVGERFDAIGDSIAARTGKLGADLDSLTESMRNVAASTASSFEEIGNILGQVSQSLDLSGPALERVTQQLADLQRMTGQAVDVHELGMALRGFGQDASFASQDLDDLYRVSASTGQSIDELTSAMVNVGPAARSLGLDFEETANLLRIFDEGGIDAGRSAMALSRAANTFAESNVDLKTGLADTITQLKAYIDAGNEAAAVALAKDVFGSRGAQQFVDLVRQGKLTTDSLTDSINDIGPSIEQVNDETRDWAENWAIIQNRVSALAETIGGPLFNALNSALGVLADLLSPVKYGQDTYASPGAPPPGNLADILVPPGLAPVNQLPPGQTAPNLLDMLGGPSTTPSGGLPGMMLPSGGAPTGTSLDEFLGSIANPNAPPATPRTPQDVQAAIDAAKKGAGSGSGLPSGPEIPMPAEYGQHLPGESLEDFQKRQSIMEAQHKIAEDNANIDALEKYNATTEEENNKKRDALIKARNDLAADENRLYTLEHQQTDKRREDIQVPYPAEAGQPPRPGETAEQYSKEQSYYDAVHKRQQAEAELAQVRGEPGATEAQITAATNELTKAKTDEYEAYLRLSDSTSKATDQLGELGAKLDQDFGISQGLPGIAENIVRFLGNLAFAPAFGAARGYQAGLGFPGGDVGGAGGLIGMAALGGAFGPQYTYGPGSQIPGRTSGATTPGVTTPGASNIAGSINTPADAAAAGNRVAALYAVAESLEGTPYSQALREDCSGAVAQIAAAAVGLPNPSPGERFNTTNEQQWLLAHGFRMGQGPPGSLRIGWNPAPGNQGHTAATLPGGENFEQGGAHSAVTIGPEAQGASGFPMQAYLPMDSTGTPRASMLVNPSSTYNWDNLAKAEASGDWHNTSNPKYSGGLQFDAATWAQYGGTRYAPTAAQATREQQISVAQRAMNARGGPQTLWPQNYSQLYAPGFEGGGPVGGGGHDWNYRDELPGAEFNPGIEIDTSKVRVGSGQPTWLTRQLMTMNYGFDVLDQRFPGAVPGLNKLPHKAFQAVGDWLGSLPQRSAAGGTIDGSTDTVPAMLTPGEHVLTADDVDAMGGQSAVYAWRRALHFDAGGGVSQLPPPDLQNLVAAVTQPAPPGQTGGTAGTPQVSPGPRLPGMGPGLPSAPGMGGVAPGQQGPTLIGGTTPPMGQGPGFGITGGGLIGLLESLPATAIQYGISAGMAAAAAAYEGGAVTEDGILGFEGGGGVGGGGGGVGAPGGDIAGSLISAALNIGIQEANRAIAYVGQLAGIGVQGLFETFLPAGASQLAANSWLTKIAGGIAGARPQIPNVAGQAASMLTQPQTTVPAPPALTGPHIGSGAAPGPAGRSGAAGGPVVNIENYNVQHTEANSGQDLARYVQPGVR